MVKKSRSKIRVKVPPPRGREEKVPPKSTREKQPKVSSSARRKSPLLRPISTKKKLDTVKAATSSLAAVVPTPVVVQAALEPPDTPAEVHSGEVGALLSRAMEAFSGLERRIQTLFSRMEERLKPSPRVEPSSPPLQDVESEDVGEVAKVFTRSVSDLLDRKLEEIIPAVAGLYYRFEDELTALREEPDLPAREYLQEFLSESLQKMGRILQELGGGFISPQVGEPYDPVIHLAVGETEVPGGQEGIVAGVVRPGYKSSRGRVVLPARVLVGKR